MRTGSGSCALAHRILLTADRAVPTTDIERVANCVGWVQPGPGSGGSGAAGLPPTPPTGLSGAPGTGGSGHPSPAAGAGSASNASGSSALLAPAAGGAVASGGNDDEDDPDVEDATLSIVCDLLLLLVSLSTGSATAPNLDLALEALLYVYLFKHCQSYFGGRIDRVLSMDNGRCVELLLAAEARAYPGGDYGRDEWAHSSLPQVISACHAFLLKTPASAPLGKLQVRP